MIDVSAMDGGNLGVEALAALASKCQCAPERHIAYVGVEPSEIAAEIGEVDDWESHTYIARVGGRLAGWVLADTDSELGRVWWWGPFVDAPEWAPVADSLMRRARADLDPVIVEEEMAGDDRHFDLAATAGAYGLLPDTASTVLSADLDSLGFVDGGRVATTADAPDIERLHRLAFPTGHLSASVAAAVDSDRRVRTVAGPDDDVASYAIAEVQPGGEGYIDFLGTDITLRGSGYGRAAISAACRELVKRGCSRVHLTVRVDNAAARSLYRSLGFVEERNLVPYRKGFSVGR